MSGKNEKWVGIKNICKGELNPSCAFHMQICPKAFYVFFYFLLFMIFFLFFIVFDFLLYPAVTPCLILVVKHRLLGGRVPGSQD